MVIYTKKGDKGETSMLDGKAEKKVRISKASLEIEVLGNIDELNSFLGVCKSLSESQSLKKILERIQENLLSIGSITAGSKLHFSRVQTKKIEKLIDNLEGKLPILKSFILPGGSHISANLHYARSLARRLERRMVSLSKVRKVRPQILEYLNRLSDLLFMLARDENIKKGIKDEVWQKRAK